MNVTLRQLEAFQAIAESGSFGAAARQLGSTQPAISKRIVELEKALGVELFDRTQRPPRLTRQGHALRPFCLDMLALRNGIARSLHDVGAYSGVLRLGVTELIALTVLPDIVKRLRRRLPLARLRVEVKLADALHQDLLEDRLDIAIAPGTPPSALSGCRAAEIEMAWMYSPTLGSMPERVPVSELGCHPILAQTQGSGLQGRVNGWLLANGVRPSLMLASNTLSALCGLTVAGLGLAVLPRAYFMPRVVTGELRILETIPPFPPLDYHVLSRLGGLADVAALASEELVAATAILDGAVVEEGR